MEIRPEKSSYKSFLKNLDYFAVTFDFRVDRKPKYGSITGGLWFIIFFFIAISYSILRLKDYLSWQDTKIQFIEKALDPGPALNFKNLNFSYAVRVTFDNDTSLKNTTINDLFILEHSFTTVKDGSGKQKIKGSSRSCKNADFYNRTSDYSIFKRQLIEDFDCFDFYDNFTLKGIYTDSEMSYSEILLKINDKYFDDYKNLEKIFNDNQFKFTLYYIDTFNDVSNYTKSVFYKIDAIYSYLDLQSYKRTNVNFQQFNYSEDQNLFYNDYKKETFMKLFSSQEIPASIQNRETSGLGEDRKYLNKFILRAVNNVKNVKLSFVKIPEFLATLSGLLVNLLLILSFLMINLNKFEAKQKIMSKMMKYKDLIKDDTKNSLDYLAKKFKKHNNTEMRNSVNSRSMNKNKISDGEIILSEDGKKIIGHEEYLINKSEEFPRGKIKKKNESFFIIKLSDIFCFVFCCKSLSNKHKIFQNAEKKFNHNIDLVTFMKKMQEVEILKYLLLDADTLQLMNFISKPCVSLSNEVIQDEEYKQFFENREDYNNLSKKNIDVVKKSYDKISAKQNISFTENRIIKLFDLQMQDILQ